MDWLSRLFSKIKELFTPFPQVTPPGPALPAPPQVTLGYVVTAIPKFDEKSANVKVMQERLVAAGHPLTVDGWFYTDTKAVVSKFQKDKGLTGTGIPGPRTMALLGIEVRTQVPISSGGHVYAKLSWENGNADRAEATKYLFGRLEADYDATIAGFSDIKKIRSDWDSLTKTQRINAFAEFMVWLCYYECGWNPKSASVDVGTQGDKGSWSIGPYQLSVNDQKWCKPRDKAAYTYEELLTWVPSIDLAMSLMNRQARLGKLLFLPNSSKYRYWAVILMGNKYSKIDAICAAVQKYQLKTPTGTLPPQAGDEVTSLYTPEWGRGIEEYMGKKESDSKWSAFLGALWTPITKLTGMGGSIVGNWRAWCALFFGFIAGLKGYDYHKSGLAAEMGAKTGKTIEYKVNGAPRFAGVWKQTNGQNHICYLWGNCTAEDLTKAGGTFDCWGGNQGDAVNVTTYKTSDIKRIFWLTKKDGSGEKFPGKVTKSIQCTSGKLGNSSTR